MKNSNPFSLVGGLHPGKTVFNLSHEKKFDGDMAYLYPILAKECIPGDTWKIGNQVVIRMNPTVAPIMHEINAKVHYFFVPTRLLMTEKEVPEGSSIAVQDLWSKFITGGEVSTDGSLALEGDSIELPRWIPETSAGYGIGTLWDYFALPIGVQPDKYNCPLAFKKRAYNLIWNEYYRNETLMSEVDIDDDNLKKVCWSKDYFTSALPWQQKGLAPALPVEISGDLDILGKGYIQYETGGGHPTGLPNSIRFYGNTPNMSEIDGDGENTNIRYMGGSDSTGKNLYVDGSQFKGVGSSITATTFDVNDLRLTVQIQKFLERNARAGSRYTSWLKAHFNVSPTDSRLDRPEYIGGSKSPIIISEVLQTSSTDDETPQGNMAGHGIVADSTYVGSYHVEEFGYIIGLLNVIPKANYMQGIDREDLRKTRYDFPMLEFTRLSEQAIKTSELYTTDDEDTNETIFGYQGRFNELRSANSVICGNLRDDLNYWHLGRVFDDVPVLNSSFLECNPRKDIFAVPSEPGLIIDFANIISVARPLPLIAEPGLVDHF